MPLTAITRAVSSSLNSCQLAFAKRERIDIGRARAQHDAYEDCLRSLGAQVISLPELADLPDAVFVEDPALVLDQAAVMTRMGAESRRGESASLAEALGQFRPLLSITPPGTLEGGDVVRIGSQIYVGESARSNAAGIIQLAGLLAPYRYTVQGVAMQGCLHLKSACTFLGRNTVLANRAWMDIEPFGNVRVIDVPETEQGAADVLAIGESVIVPASFPQTAGILEEAGWRVLRLDVSELQKAEAGVTCMSLLFESEPRPPARGV